MNSFTLKIPMVPPSPNELRRKYRNVHAYKRLRDLWQSEIVYGATSAYVLFRARSLADGRVKANIEVSHMQLFDKDNLYGAVKPILDALKRAEFIKDDSPEWLDLSVSQVRGGKYTTIQLSAALREFQEKS